MGLLITGVAALVIVLGAFVVILQKVLQKQSQDQVAFFEKRIQEQMKVNQEQFLLLAGQQFKTEQAKVEGEMEVRKQAVETWVTQLKEELQQYQKIVRDFEQDRSVKYGKLENELKNASLATQRLQDTTNHLNNILGNVKLRGQWGERMAEDIIRYAGLIEGVNYEKQKKQDNAATKPDYAFFLPNGHRVNMDAKFPLDNYIKMVNLPEGLDREAALKEFLKNVKQRIKEIQNREYINPAESTLDFVLLFIPNEQVFGFIQENLPELMSEALKDKVVLCSPFTLYAMLSVIRQAHENFRYENDIRKIIGLIEQFVGYYERFKGRFDDELGKHVEKLNTLYADIKTKNFVQMDTKIRQIEDYKKGNPSLGAESLPLVEVELDLKVDATRES
ncbi:MAG: DNA recombination protein RmuC [Candidatus Omnitrophica bacterium]|nr:DNA recombination protein RmuC [Candidatus Omnitrophota bacterium]